MASCIITNPSIEICALPFPFAGVLKGRQSIKLNVSSATVTAALGGEAAASALLVKDAEDGGPYDTAYQGSVGTSPLNEASLVVTGDSDLQGAVAVGTDLTVGDDATITDDLTVGGDAAITGTLAAGATTITGAITASTTVTGADLAATDDLTVGDDAAITGALTVGETATITGDIDAAGGFPLPFGPFVQDNVAANQAAVVVKLGATAAPQVDAVAWRAGSLRGIVASFTVAPAGTDLVVSILKNGVLLHATAILTVAAGAALGRTVTFAKDNADLLFAAGDRIGVTVTTGAGWTATTSDMAVYAIVEG